jgi:hypothetical protein
MLLINNIAVLLPLLLTINNTSMEEGEVQATTFAKWEEHQGIQCLLAMERFTNTARSPPEEKEPLDRLDSNDITSKGLLLLVSRAIMVVLLISNNSNKVGNH